MMRSLRLLQSLISFFVVFLALAGKNTNFAQGKGQKTLGTKQSVFSAYPRQSNVTWDEYSFFINGKRVMLWSGEVHPYRLPVPDLYLDIFQKVKSLGFNTVSFYIFWGLLEPKRGDISFEGLGDLQPFFDAAKLAGIYLLARPGPYINAETTAGGFPGWATYTPGLWRTSNSSYRDAYTGYVKAVGRKLAENEITKGGPIILVQTENEYTSFQDPYTEDFVYEQELMQAWLDAGITVPITTNDASPSGHYTSVDVWGYDSYPVLFDCSHPYRWNPNAVQEYLWDSHMKWTPNILNAVYEYQAGSYDGWGGSGYSTCYTLTGPEFERVFYKSEVAMSTTFLNLYMLFGGTNWGHIGHPGVYTSYDYGSAIAEDRSLTEKYYELKLQANFLAVSPAYLTTRPQNVDSQQGAFTGNQALKTTQVLDVVGNKTGFYIVRQSDLSITDVQKYKLTVPTSRGNLTLPTIAESLTLNGKDSKIHLVDYTAGSTHLLYSTAEIMTWATIDGRVIIVLYGNIGETHETAIDFGSSPSTETLRSKVVSGAADVKQKVIDGQALALQYTTTGKTVVLVGGSTILYIIDRAHAYDFWVLHPISSSGVTLDPIIVQGGYLLRTATIDKGNLAITGDLNATAVFEIIAPQADSKTVTFNGVNLDISPTSYGTLLAQKLANLPDVTLPELTKLGWKYVDSLPEISPSYSDSAWTVANYTPSNNADWMETPVVLFAGHYGYHSGSILFRAHFDATGTETGFKVKICGGSAFAFSVWLDSTWIGSWEGDAVRSEHEASYAFPGTLAKDSSHVITILQDHMGYEEEWTAGEELFKTPRGVLSYSFVGSSDTSVGVWKVTGNLGGESHADKVRGPFNEGGLYAERQGWHLPGFNDSSWAFRKPTSGISSAGVGFYRTTFQLDIPNGVDYPISIVVTNSTINPHFRVQFYVNGYQFGKFVNHIGPQKVFPVPQGIWNYQGDNTLAVSLWAANTTGAKLDSLKLQINAKMETGFPPVVNAPAPTWTQRPGAY